MACYLPLKVYFKIMYICVCVHVRYVYISVSTCGSPKGVSGPLELQLQTARHHLTWVLGIKLQSTASTPRILNYCALSSLRKVMSIYNQWQSSTEQGEFMAGLFQILHLFIWGNICMNGRQGLCRSRFSAFTLDTSKCLHLQSHLDGTPKMHYIF